MSNATLASYCIALTASLVAAILLGTPAIVVFLALCALGIVFALRSGPSAD
jgi:hypothetical protein